MTAPSVGTTLIEAIAAQDESALRHAFARDAELRALVPHRLRERSGAESAAALIAGWFAGAGELPARRVADGGGRRPRVHVTWRSI